MAQITLTIPDEHIQRILDAFADRYVYDPESGLTKAQFARRKLRDYVKEVLIAVEGARVRQQGIDALQAEVDGIDIT